MERIVAHMPRALKLVTPNDGDLSSVKPRERSPRAALSAERAVDVINLFATHPTGRFSLTEISKKTDINPASLHALLGVLTAAGFLTRRHNTRDYGIGPALIPLGHTSLQQSPTIEHALQHSENLSAELDVEIVVSVVTPVNILIIGVVGPASPFGQVLFPGQKIPLVPPLGAVMLAWETPKTIDAWLKRAPRALSPEDQQEQLAILQSVRRLGYSIARESDTARIIDEPHAANTADLSSKQNHPALAREIDARSAADSDLLYHVVAVNAPVFDDSGRVALAISARGVAVGKSAKEVHSTAEHLRGSALVITKQSGGRIPDGLSTGVKYL